MCAEKRFLGPPTITTNIFYVAVVLKEYSTIRSSPNHIGLHPAMDPKIMIVCI